MKTLKQFKPTENHFDFLNAVDPMFKANMASLEADFDHHYSVILDIGYPDEVPDEQMEAMRGDLFTAFCFGFRAANDPESNFRKNFVMPDEYKKDSENIVSQIVGLDGKPLSTKPSKMVLV